MKTLNDLRRCYGLDNFLLVDVGAKDQLDFCPALAAVTDMHAFEPHPAEYRRLCGRYNSHPFRTLQLVQTGLADRLGNADFWLTGHGAMSSLLEPDTAHYAMHFGAYREYPQWEQSLKPAEKISIALQTADDYFRKSTSVIDYLKLDTQGSELQILLGAQALLEAQRISVIKVEVSTIPLYKGQAVFSDIDQYLRGRDFMLVDFVSYRNDRQPLFRRNRPAAHYAPCGDALYVHLRQNDAPASLWRKSLILQWQGYHGLAAHLAKQAGASEQELQVLQAISSVRDQSFGKRLLGQVLPPALFRFFKHG